MNFWTINISLIFILCVALGGIFISKILFISFRLKLFDMPDERKIHHGVVPRLGGLAFIPVIFFSIALLLGVNLVLDQNYIFLEINKNIQILLFGSCSFIILYLVGIVDDLVGVRYLWKFLVQIFCSIMLIAGGISISDLHGLLGIQELPIGISYLLTILFVVFIINAINLIDGIDGLASGLNSIALFIYGLTFTYLNQWLFALLSFATLGVLCSFFFYNVFGKIEHKQKIFMGDTGSLTVGSIICILSIKIFDDPTVSSLAYNPSVLALSPLIIPSFDVIRVFLHRIRRKKHPFMPDKNHIHHKLLAIGISQNVAMITIVLVAILLSISNILLSRYININLLLIGDVFVWLLGNIWLTEKIRQHKLNPTTIAYNNNLEK